MKFVFVIFFKRFQQRSRVSQNLLSFVFKDWMHFKLTSRWSLAWINSSVYSIRFSRLSSIFGLARNLGSLESIAQAPVRRPSSKSILEPVLGWNYCEIFIYCKFQIMPFFKSVCIWIKQTLPVWFIQNISVWNISVYLSVCFIHCMTYKIVAQSCVGMYYNFSNTNSENHWQMALKTFLWWYWGSKGFNQHNPLNEFRKTKEKIVKNS